MLNWKSKSSGTFEASVKINGEHVDGSPFAISLSSSNPELTRSTLTGEGLKMAVAGSNAAVRISFFDQFGNTSTTGPHFRFGLSMLKEREKLTPTTKEYAQVGDWFDRSKGIYELTYIAEAAGNFELHVWCDPQGEGERLPFPGSPFAIHVLAGKATAAMSQVSPERSGLGWDCS